MFLFMSVVQLPRRPAPAKPVEPESIRQAVASGSPFLSVGELLNDIAPILREGVERKRSGLESGWVEFISRSDWQWFATFTFKDETHPETADKSFKYWCRLLDESNGYKSGTKSTHIRRCTWVRGLEWQKRGVVHFHALIGNLPWDIDTRTSRSFWQEAWCTMLKVGIARIHPVEDVGGVAGYISKYCAKGGEVDLSPNLGKVLI